MYKHNAQLRQLCDSVTCAPNGHIISLNSQVLATFASPSQPPGMPDVEPIVSPDAIQVKTPRLGWHVARRVATGGACQVLLHTRRR
jgi:hypothetical protein